MAHNLGGVAFGGAFFLASPWGTAVAQLSQLALQSYHFAAHFGEPSPITVMRPELGR